MSEEEFRADFERLLKRIREERACELDAMKKNAHPEILQEFAADAGFLIGMEIGRQLAKGGTDENQLTTKQQQPMNVWISLDERDAIDATDSRKLIFEAAQEIDKGLPDADERGSGADIDEAISAMFVARQLSRRATKGKA